MAITIGSNIKTCSHLAGQRRLYTYLNFNSHGRGRKNIPIFTKAGVPASNTAADDPGVAPAWILDTTNGDVYHCHTRVSSSSFTIVKVSN